MGNVEPGTPRDDLSLAQLVALSDELEALVRAGVPVERGLLAAAGDYGGRLGRAMRDLAGRLEAGESLSRALEGGLPAFPRVFAAVVEAGLRTGRLADALQGLSRVGQAVVEARRTIVTACTYPLAVLLLAYAFFLGFVAWLLPRYQAMAASFGFDHSPVVGLLTRAGASAALWGGAPPLVLLILGALWVRSGRSRRVDGGDGAGSGIGRFPWVGEIVASYRAANFTDLLAHLIENDVPLDRAVRLAGEATGGRQLRAAGAALADRIAAGATNEVGGEFHPAFPPLVAWMLGAGHRQGELAAGLRHLATSYRRKARRRAETFRAVLPGLLVVTVGAGAVLAYGLLLFLPILQLWDALASPSH